MPKILISALRDRSMKRSQNGDISEGNEREYKTLNTILGMEMKRNIPSSQLHLPNIVKIDKVILIGTVHSMWKKCIGILQRKTTSL